MPRAPPAPWHTVTPFSLIGPAVGRTLLPVAPVPLRRAPPVGHRRPRQVAQILHAPAAAARRRREREVTRNRQLAFRVPAPHAVVIQRPRRQSAQRHLMRRRQRRLPSGDIVPYAVVSPYSTCVSAATSVVQLIVAPVVVTFVAETLVITGGLLGVPPPPTFLSTETLLPCQFAVSMSRSPSASRSAGVTANGVRPTVNVSARSEGAASKPASDCDGVAARVAAHGIVAGRVGSKQIDTAVAVDVAKVHTLGEVAHGVMHCGIECAIGSSPQDAHAVAGLIRAGDVSAPIPVYVGASNRVGPLPTA